MVDGDIRMFSRKHKEFVACPHIAKNEFVKTFFEMYPDAILDGELYNHELKDDFNKIVSLVKKTKPKAEDLEESAKLVQYHCFDSYYPGDADLPYIHRKGRLLYLWINYTTLPWEDKQPLSYDNFRVVGTIPMKWQGGVSVGVSYIHTENDVEKEIELFTSQGYEGIMLKKDVPYFFGRSFDMLKYKKFFDKEFKIVDFEEGNGNLVGIAAAVICETEDGQTFKAGVMGTQDYARDLFTNKDLYKGKMATIVYQALTPMKDGKGGVPRFGKMREIRNYE
jgi:DNA ligase-1